MKILETKSIEMKIGKDKLRVQITEDNQVFIHYGKSGQDERAYCEGLARLTACALQGGVKLEKIINHLTGIQGRDTNFAKLNDGTTIKVTGIVDAIGKAFNILK